MPVETFTFLFTDIEGSTALLGRVRQDVYARVPADHHAIIRSGLAGHGGREVDTQGDAFFAVFSSPAACVALDVARQTGKSWDEAHALTGLGRCAMAADYATQAEILLRQALEIFQRVGAAEAAEVSAELQALSDARPTTHRS
ncbi:MAG TPA: adenylate/guanylate cyclase domain-containing protein [Streptosporangiaceae bacterium]